MNVLGCSTLVVLAMTVYLLSCHAMSWFDKMVLATSLCAQVLVLVGLFTKDKVVTEISHCAFGAVLVAVAFFGRSKYLLMLAISCIALSLLSRFAIGKCMFEWETDGKEASVQLYPDFHWDWVYAALLCTALARFHSIHGIIGI